MRGPRILIGLWLVILPLTACEPSPPPAVTQPPPPADVIPWVDIVWSTADLPPKPGAVEAERIVAVTAGADGFVAVGYHELEGIRDGAIWFSEDGSVWVLADARAILADVELLDVTLGPAGFVALGIATGGALGDHWQAVFLRSVDGRAWERLAPTPGTVDTYPASLAGGDQGVVATGHASAGGPATWFSPDGRTFERVAAEGAAARGIIDPSAVAGGFTGLGANDGSPVLLRSTDGVAWTSTTIDRALDVAAHRLSVGRWGLVAQGIFATGCSPLASCPAQAIAWWSGDGEVWGRLPLDPSPTTNGGSIVVPAGDHGFLALDGASAWASADGWAWTPLPEPGDGSSGVNDAVVRGDVIVAVGQEDLEDGSSVGRILVARQGQSSAASIARTLASRR